MAFEKSQKPEISLESGFMTKFFRVDAIATESADAIGSNLMRVALQDSHHSIENMDRGLEVTDRRKELSNKGVTNLQKSSSRQSFLLPVVAFDLSRL